MVKAAVKVILVVVGVGIGAVSIAIGALAWWFGQAQVDIDANSGTNMAIENGVGREANNQQMIIFHVPQGTHGRAFARRLAEQQLIPNARLNYWAARLFTDAGNLQAGYYQVKQDDSAKAIWQRVMRGEQHQFSITFVEGSQYADWQLQISNHPHIRAQAVTLPPDQVMQRLAPDGDFTHPEGLLFPDTYRFQAGTSDWQILQQAYRRMQSHLDNLWASRSRMVPVESPYEALILASIVEKETGADHERGLVASVFVNRLNINMRLQSDPTIVYGLGDDYRGVIYRSDISKYTPYNTYRINGLPPTPIAMPGYEALHATLNPADSDYFYFVSSNDGQHIFSRTLEEHNRAVYRYQRN